MVMVTKRQCNVFKTTRDVECYCVKVVKCDELETELSVCLAEMTDLSPRGLARLEKFIRRGLTAPSASGIGEASNDGKQGDEEGGTGC